MQKTQKTRVQSLGWENPLEKGMATHSGVLAWEIPWTEEPGGLYSPWGHKESDTTERLHFHIHFHYSDRACQVVQWVKNPPANSGDVADTDLTPGLGRSPGVGNGNPLWCSCLGNPWREEPSGAAVHGVAKESDTI